jgi:hypothetical protein
MNNLIFQDKIVTLNKKEISENYLGYFQQAEKSEYFLVIFNNRKFPENFLDIISNRKLQPDFPVFFFNQLSFPECFHTKANLKDLIVKSCVARMTAPQKDFHLVRIPPTRLQILIYNYM